MEENMVLEENVVVNEESEVQAEKKASFFDKVKGVAGKAWDGTKKVAKGVKDDPEKLLTGLAVAGTGLLVLVGIKQQKEIDRMSYDDKTGEVVTLRHKLNNKEKIELAERMDETGESKTTTLNRMNLIK